MSYLRNYVNMKIIKNVLLYVNNVIDRLMSMPCNYKRNVQLMDLHFYYYYLEVH